MAKKDYLHPKWQKKRLEILSRDNFTCRGCLDEEETLHVHHHYYINGQKVWDYLDSCLITLCEKCHKDYHDNKQKNITHKWDRVIIISSLLDTMNDHGFNINDYYKAIFDSTINNDYIPYYVFNDKKHIKDPIFSFLDLIEAALYYHISWKNIGKYADYCIKNKELLSPKKIYKLKKNKEVING